MKLVLLGVLAAMSAGASIIVELDDVTPLSPLLSRYDYSIRTNAFGILDSSTTVTLYDLLGVTAAGLVGNVFAPSGWSVSPMAVGFTPQGTFTPDDPNRMNVTWFRTDTSVVTGVTSVSGFSIITPLRWHSTIGWVTGTVVFNGVDGNFGTVSAPSPAPEPGTVAMFIIGLGLIAWRIRSKA